MKKIKWSIVGLVCLGLVAALCAAVLVAMLRSGDSLRSTQNAPKDVTIVVAVKALPAMAIVDAAGVSTKTVLVSEVPVGAFANPSLVIGKALSVPMVAGQVFTKACFAPEGSSLLMAASIPEGKRAVSLSLPDHSRLEGLLYPGSIVDVIASFEAPSEAGGGNAIVSTTLLQGIQVLAVEHQTVFTAEEEKPGQSGSVRQGERRLVTLLVEPAQATALQLGMDHGTLSLAMRNPLDRRPVDPKPMVIGDLVRSTASEMPRPVVVAASVSPTKPEAARKVEKPEAPRWEVLILRGGTQEKQSFEVAAPASGG